MAKVACFEGLRYGRHMTAKKADDHTHFGFRTVRTGEKPQLVRAIFDDVAVRYDLMNDLMSVGIHRLWKLAMIDWLAPRSGARYLDVAGGTGDIALRILDRLAAGDIKNAGGARITVVDASESMLQTGRDRAVDAGVLNHIEWVHGDAECLPIDDQSIDFFSIAFGIRNIARIDIALAEARRVLKPGGRFLCLEFSHVLLPVLSSAYDAYSFRVLPALGEIITGNRGAYQYLAESIRRFPHQEEFAAMIGDAGLGQVKVRNLSGGIAALHSAWRI
jgi:demethylmenaquinone methyltransferase/2-methoxy-6-polyprenyl-1,4-benzoquinol methylase